VPPGVSGGASPPDPSSPAGLRGRLARLFGRNEAIGNVPWRRIVHGAGAFVLVYYLIPAGFFVLVSKEVALLLALAAAFVLELCRLALGVPLPTIRGYERDRPASFVFYAVGLVVAVLLFPVAIAAAVVLGTAIVDPLAGELRARHRPGPAVWVSFAVYTGMAGGLLAGVGGWPWAWAVVLGALAGVVAVGVERWRFRWLDDDLTMTVVPAMVLYGTGVVALGLAR